MRKLGLLLLVSAVACTLHATARPVAAQSPLDPSLPPYRAEEKLSGKLTLAGSYTMSQVASVWADSFRQMHPGAEIDVQVIGSVGSVNAVNAGEAHIGLLSRSILRSEVQDFQREHGHSPVVLTPMHESIGVFVHKDNPIKGLTFEQLDAIFSFTLRRGASKPAATWGDLGLKGEWASKPIQVRGRRQATGVQVYFQEVVLAGGEFRRTSKKFSAIMRCCRRSPPTPMPSGSPGRLTAIQTPKWCRWRLKRDSPTSPKLRSSRRADSTRWFVRCNWC